MFKILENIEFFCWITLISKVLVVVGSRVNYSGFGEGLTALDAGAAATAVVNATFVAGVGVGIIDVELFAA